MRSSTKQMRCSISQSSEGDTIVNLFPRSGLGRRRAARTLLLTAFTTIAAAFALGPVWADVSEEAAIQAKKYVQRVLTSFPIAKGDVTVGGLLGEWDPSRATIINAKLLRAHGAK